MILNIYHVFYFTLFVVFCKNSTAIFRNEETIVIYVLFYFLNSVLMFFPFFQLSKTTLSLYCLLYLISNRSSALAVNAEQCPAFCLLSPSDQKILSRGNAILFPFHSKEFLINC